MAEKAVPESILKKRKRDDEWAAKQAALALQKKEKRRLQRKDIFKRAEKYVQEYRQQVCFLDKFLRSVGQICRSGGDLQVDPPFPYIMAASPVPLGDFYLSMQSNLCERITGSIE